MTTTETTFEEAAAAVDAAIGDLDRLDDEARASALALKDAVEAFHRPALVHIVRTLRDDPAGRELLFGLAGDPAVRAVLGLHGIIKADPMTRADRALATVRPYLHSHGGDVELVSIEDGAARVRLQGSCTGCSMSAVTLQNLVTEALVVVDEVDRVEVVEDQPTSAFIPVESVGVKRRGADSGDTGWVRGPAIDEVAPGSMIRFDPDADTSFVVTNIDNRVAAFRNACVHQGRTLDGGMLDDGVLVCPWHGFRFEASTGECISAPGAQLEQFPVRVDDGAVWIRVRGA